MTASLADSITYPRDSRPFDHLYTSSKSQLAAQFSRRCHSIDCDPKNLIPAASTGEILDF